MERARRPAGDTLDGLMRWYAAQCNGDWEHTYGVKIDSLDNPGWYLKIDLTDTALQSVVFATIEHDMADPVSWWRCWREGTSFHAACGPALLQIVLDVFLDWAESYVGQPFFSFEYLLQHFRRACDERAKFESRVINAYKNPWQELISDDCISEALALAPLAAVFAYAVGGDTWKDPERHRDPKIAGYFRSLARRMNHEALQLERRSSCLS